MSELPSGFKSVDKYEDTVGTFLDVVNNNTDYTNLLVQGMSSSGVIPDHTGRMFNCTNQFGFHQEDVADPTNILFEDWYIYFASISKIVHIDSLSINLMNVSLMPGERHIYIKDDGTYEVTLTEDREYDQSKVYLAVARVYNKLVNDVPTPVLDSFYFSPDIIGTSRISRTAARNSLNKVYSSSVSAVADETGIKLSLDSDTLVLMEGCSVYNINIGHDPNLSIVESGVLDLIEIPANNKFPYPTGDFKEYLDTTHYLDPTTNELKVAESGKYVSRQLSLSPDGTLAVQFSSHVYDSFELVKSLLVDEYYNYVNNDLSTMYTPVARIAVAVGANSNTENASYILQAIVIDESVTSGGDSAAGAIQSSIVDIQNQLDSFIETSTDRLDSLDDRNRLFIGKTQPTNPRGNDLWLKEV